MATPCNKRYCQRKDDLDDEDFDDFEAVFPSDEEDEPSQSKDCFFPSESSNLTVIELHESESEAENSLSVSSLSESGSESDEDLTCDTELEKIGTILVSPCCKKECLRLLTAMDAINSRKEINQFKNKADQRKWLHQMLTDSSSQSNDGIVNTAYFIAGKEVCPVAWCKVYSISQRTFKRLHQQVTFCDSLSRQKEVKYTD